VEDKRERRNETQKDKENDKEIHRERQKLGRKNRK
jgi:hypothetical protein